MNEDYYHLTNHDYMIAEGVVDGWTREDTICELDMIAKRLLPVVIASHRYYSLDGFPLDSKDVADIGRACLTARHFLADEPSIDELLDAVHPLALISQMWNQPYGVSNYIVEVVWPHPTAPNADWSSAYGTGVTRHEAIRNACEKAIQKKEAE